MDRYMTMVIHRYKKLIEESITNKRSLARVYKKRMKKIFLFSVLFPVEREVQRLR